MSLDPMPTGSSVSRHGLLAHAFEELGRNLGPFIDGHMSQYFADDLDWAATAANRMGRAADHQATDPLFQLLVLRRFWGPVFARHFGEDLRGTITELLEVRNQWAHFNLPEDPAALERSILGIERLLAPVAPLAVGPVRTLRAAARSGGSDAPPAAPPTDLVTLEAQLSEAEAAFEQLQRRHDALAVQLHASRRAAATKQLRLTAAEQHVEYLEDRSNDLEQVIATEREAFYRIEWLFVGFIAVMILLLVLIAG